MKTNQTEITIKLPVMEIKKISILIVGDSSLIMHAWSHKAQTEMLDKQMKKAKGPREAKDPQKEYEQSMYKLPNGDPCFPATGFKNAAVDACSHADGITKVEARGAFHIIGDMVPIEGKPEMRQDMVRIGMGTADIRFRAEFKKWKALLCIRYNANLLSADQIVNLFNIAGFSIGIGEWRPQRDGSFGMFHVESPE